MSAACSRFVQALTDQNAQWLFHELTSELCAVPAFREIWIPQANVRNNREKNATAATRQNGFTLDPA